MSTATKERPRRWATAPAPADGGAGSDHHRRRILAVIIVVGVGLLAAGWAATRSPLLAVSRVEVSGAIHTSVDQVAAVGRLRHRRPMTDVDEAAAARAIERLAWVHRATVHRRWPGRVDVTLVERVPVASAPT